MAVGGVSSLITGRLSPILKRMARARHPFSFVGWPGAGLLLARVLALALVGLLTLPPQLVAVPRTAGASLTASGTANNPAPAARRQAAEAVPAFTALQARAYAEVLKLRPDSARALLGPELQRTTRLAEQAALADPRTVLVLDCADFTEVVLRQDAARYPAAMATMRAHLALVTEAATRTPGPWAALADAEIRLHLAVTQICFQDEIRGAWDLRQAIVRLEVAAARYPDFAPLRKSLGICQFLLGIVPDQYRWFMRLLGLPDPAPATGLANLTRAADEPNPFQTEARLFRALILEGYYQQPGPVLALTTALYQRQPDNLLFCYLYMAALRRARQPEQALRVFRGRPQGRAYVPLWYLHHLAADLLLYRGDFAASARENEFFLRRYPGVHYRKDAAFKLYLAGWLGHDGAAATRWLAAIDRDGAHVIEEDRAAQRFFTERPPLDQQLTRARLAADGGYWKTAQRQLNAFSLTAATPRELQAEWCYRQAKVYQGQNRLDSARFFYQRTVAVQGDAPRYFAPNAALQLGFLARQTDDRQGARQWFEKALRYPQHEYKRSIDAQAKAGLAALTN